MGFDIFAFPFEQIGWALRRLSLSGAVGNLIAIVLYILISMIPFGIYLYMRERKVEKKIDLMLPLLSCFLFELFYFMINPGLLPVTMLGMGKSLWGGTFYSLVVGYLILRMVVGVKKDMNSLQRGLRIVLYSVMFLFLWSVVIEFFFHLPAAIDAVKMANTAVDISFLSYGDSGLMTTYVFLALKSIINALFNVFCAVTIFFSIQTLNVLLEDGYCEKAVLLAKKVALLCKRSLIAVLVANMGFHMVQLFFMEQLHQINLEINIPIFSILFLLAIHMMARFIEENQKLKEENELFI